MNLKPNTLLLLCISKNVIFVRSSITFRVLVDPSLALQIKPYCNSLIPKSQKKKKSTKFSEEIYLGLKPDGSSKVGSNAMNASLEKLPLLYFPLSLVRGSALTPLLAS